MPGLALLTSAFAGRALVRVVVARLAASLRVRARLTVRALAAVIAAQLAGLGLVLARDALDACCHARVRRNRARRTLERLGTADRAAGARRASGAAGCRREAVAGIVRPRGAGLALGTGRLDLAIVAWVAWAGAERATEPGSGAIATSRALFRLLRPGFAVESRRAQHALESAERAIPPPLARLALTQLRNVSKGASGARDGDGAAVRARVAQWARHASGLPP